MLGADSLINVLFSFKRCQNGAMCTNSPSDAIGYRCNCPRDFAGVNCDIKVNSCRAAPCQNGGSCSVTSNGDYQCRCQAGFAGKNCEVCN